MNQASSATGMPISEVPMKKFSKPVRSIMKPEAPARRLPGSAQSEVISAYWLAASSVEASEDMYDEHDLRKGVGEAFDTDSEGKAQEVALAAPGEPGEAQMRGRPGDRAKEQARYQPDLAHDIARQKRTAERNPEAEYFCHCRNVRVGNVEALEQGHGHCTRHVAGHAEACDEQQHGDRPRPEPAHKLLNRRDDGYHEAGMVAMREKIGFGLGREKGG